MVSLSAFSKGFYNLIISHSKKFIFVHIYKTGGTSVTASLLPYARFIEKITAYYPTKKLVSLINKVFGLSDNGNKWINGLHKHAMARDIKEYVGRNVFDDYFKFAFVRNPYDLQVSLYHYIKQHEDHRDSKIANEVSFEEFVEREISQKKPLQSDFLMNDKGEIVVDFIGKTENLNDDILSVFERLNIQSDSIKMTSLNKSKRRADYDSYYTPELKRKVYEYYKKDFEIFGYAREF